MMRGSIRTVWLAILLILGSAGVSRAAVSEQVFEVHPPEDAAKAHPLKLVLTGEIFSPGQQYFPAASGARQDPLLDFLARLSMASREGTPADFLAMWSPSEREAKKPAVNALFARNQEVARTVVRSSLRARLMYGPYVLAVVRHEVREGSAMVSVYPLMHEGESDFLTDRLASDPAFTLLVTTLRERFKDSQ
jgi:hypothetical protein